MKVPQQRTGGVVDGGHNWKTWKTLWDIILDKISSKKQRIPAEALRASAPHSAIFLCELSLDRNLFFK